MLTAVWLAGCGDEQAGGDGADGPENTSADTGETGPAEGGESGPSTGGSGDTSDTGDTGPADTGDPIPSGWAFEDAIGVINSDDDDESGKRDWLKPPHESDDDLVMWMMPADAFDEFADGDTVELLLDGPAPERVRMWRGDTPVIGHDSDEIHMSYTFAPSGGDEHFWVEFDDYGTTHTLTINHLDSNGAVVESAEVRLRSAPLLMNHHLQPAEFVWAVSVNSNDAFIGTYQSELGDKFAAVSGGSVGGDVWIQDEVEFATGTSPNHRINIIIDSIRDRGLDNFPDQIVQPNFFKNTWGIPGTQTSADSFGNLECSPPVTVNGVEYPFGRIYYGKTPSWGINDVIDEFLESQEIQDPVQLDTEWLCVGHVDEFSTFVPDPNSAKGFKLLYADVDAAFDLLESLPANMQLPRYGNGHGYPSVGSMLSDIGLRAENEDLRDDHLAYNKQIFMTEFGLDESDIIGIPTLFERVQGCQGGVAALMPGMVNLIVANFEGETPKLFVPDPFFRSTINDQSTDPLLAAFRDLMPEGLECVFTDDWYTYHMALGEVHCGTNVLREPIANWWD